MKRGSDRRWLQKNVPKKKRALTAHDLAFHRTAHFSAFAYERERNFDCLRREFGFDIEAWLRARLPKKRKLYVLDSGSGLLGISADAKKAFGDRAFVTALNVVSPRLPKVDLVELVAKRSDINLEGITEDARKDALKSIRAHIRKLREAEKHSKLIDECRVSSIEGFSTKRKYDAIIDIYGPHVYSKHRERVFAVYFSLLRANGAVLMITFPSVLPAFVELKFGEGSTLAKRTGYYFSAERIGGRVFEIRKLRLRQKKPI